MRHIAITGAGAGLGRVTAERFAAAGDQVYACDLDAGAIQDLKKSGSTIMAKVVDVSALDQVNEFFDAIQSRTMKVDVLSHNVGVAGPRALVENIDTRDWSRTLDANVNAAFWSMRRVLPAMKSARSGVILNVSTFSVRTLPEARAAYTVSKAALEALTRAVAREAGPCNVRCNAIQPGAMDNDRLRRIMEKLAAETGKSVAETEQEQLRFMSMRSKVSMDDVASLLQFLASDVARYITSQVIAIDAGAQWEM